MKKVKIVIGIVFVVLTTILLGMNSEKMYQKQEQFNSVNDVLYKLETNDLRYYDKKGSRFETDAFKECLSRRKRLTNSDMDMLKIKINEIIKLNEEEKNSILADYNNLRKNYKVKDQKIITMEPVRIKAKVYYENGTVFENGKYNTKYSEENNIITFVLIDEGEGLVIDYVVTQNMN